MFELPGRWSHDSAADPMYFLYTLLLTIAFIVLSPRFLFDAIFNGKYAAGFWQRMGRLPAFDAKGRSVVWLHCVSVGEANAARPLALKLKETFPDISLVVSTTTRTGQELAKTAFADVADMVFYFPFDWRFSVRRSLRHFDPSVVLLTETELWFNFIREAYKNKTRVAIVNGRLSERSFKRYSLIKTFMKRVLGYLDAALMQENADATRLMSLGIRGSKVKVTGNLKFDHDLDALETSTSDELRDRFSIDPQAPLIIAASTHSPEEKYVLDAFKEVWRSAGESLPRLLIAPRHPERFADVADLIKKTGFTWVRRSEAASPRDRTAEVILLDSIGELRAVYSMAEIVFVGGSLIQHGGQSIFEPAAAGKAIVTGPHTANFDAVVTQFVSKDAIIQLPQLAEADIVPALASVLNELLSDREKREAIGANALAAMRSSRGAVEKTIEYLTPVIEAPRHR